MGLTVWEVLADLYMAIKWKPCTIGMYTPDASLAAYKSEHRFMRLVRTIPTLHQAMQTKNGDGNKLTRTLGESIFRFLWTSGVVHTESVPADVVSFDEVQGMDPDDISRTRERLSASRIRFSLLLSTPKWPDSDIHFWYQRGTQHEFHTHCEACGNPSILSQHFPQCVKEISGQWCYVCPHCGAMILDAQQGQWIATYPEREIISYHLSQFLSPTITPGQLMDEWMMSITGAQRANFTNRKLGLPYSDPSQIPVNRDHLNECVRLGQQAGVVWKTSGVNTYMGIDQMGGWNAVLIKEKLPDGRQALIHAEAVYGYDPFVRCDELLKQYGVVCCVVEGLPNWNDAKRFANRNPGRVFVASYGDQQDTMVWGDQIVRTDLKTSQEDRDRFSVRLSQYKAMQVALSRIVQGHCLFPDPSGLVCEYRDGTTKRVALLRDVVFEHLTRVALITERDAETSRWKSYVKKIGIDPHYAYANMLCDVAWSRAFGQGTFMLPTQSLANDLREQMAEKLPGIDPEVLHKIDAAAYAGTCGACLSFDSGRCVDRGFRVGAADPACERWMGG